ncbi:Xylogen-like protein 11 [Sesamum alatum]|uniref:Xylogen-like protein 11 n=1 Tax=Sesamum alatum TaxID=300844 RepID=A0AAE1XY41_9LAMI|nr:Xylogen-like protein 11 [Sesamum alatum]
MAKAKSTSTTAYLLILAAIFAAALPSLSAQSPAPAPEPMLPMSPTAAGPAPDCFQYLINLSDCLTFVEAGSNLTKPDPGCCPELGNLVNTQPVCLCELLGQPGQVGISIDVNRALKLPSACNVTTPPVSLCAAIGIPVGVPAPSEAPSDGISVAASPSPGTEDNPNSSNFSLNLKPHFLIGFAALCFTYFF